MNTDRKEYEEPVYMFATVANHKTGPLNRMDGSLCCIIAEEGGDYIGHWVTGFGFIEVRFPKRTTRELTPEEKARYDGMKYVINDQPLIHEVAIT